VVEHHNATVVGAARSMLKARGMLDIFWREAVLTTVYVLNRSPIKSANGATPYEVWYGRKPSIHHLHTFGCVAHVRNTKPHLSKQVAAAWCSLVMIRGPRDTGFMIL
jgi:hypothetical protein